MIGPVEPDLGSMPDLANIVFTLSMVVVYLAVVVPLIRDRAQPPAVAR